MGSLAFASFGESKEERVGHRSRLSSGHLRLGVRDRVIMEIGMLGLRRVLEGGEL